ncbi:MAG: hypothetical protein IIW51_08290, partial [Peptococcaceae bacterium]|nr:hypothetical protein [Peptococcaceae bacterium]
MKTILKDMLYSMPNSLKVFFIVLFVVAVVSPKTLLALIVMVPVNLLFIIIAITRSGQFHFLITMILCFA